MIIVLIMVFVLIDYDAEEGEFAWDIYLAKTGATAVPPRAFKPRSPVGFKTGMKLECVDPRNPQLIRVATVAAVKVLYFDDLINTLQTISRKLFSFRVIA